LLDDVARGAYQLEPFGASDIALAGRIIERYASHRIGLADASLVVLAERHRARDLLTLDRRHFRVVRRLNGRAFRVLPKVSQHAGSQRYMREESILEKRVAAPGDPPSSQLRLAFAGTLSELALRVGRRGVTIQRLHWAAARARLHTEGIRG
jgi:hypothetical protein